MFTTIVTSAHLSKTINKVYVTSATKAAKAAAASAAACTTPFI